MSEKNEMIICVDCGQEFELTDGWHKLLKENPNLQPPKRCYTCRQIKKRDRERENEGIKDW